MTTCNHEYIEWRGREVCQECGEEKDYGKNREDA